MRGDFTVVGLFTSHSFIDIFRENVSYKTPTFIFGATKNTQLLSAISQLSENNAVALRGRELCG